MTMPGGEANLNDEAWIAEWVARNNLSTLPGRTQEAVTEHYREQVSSSTAWGPDGGFLDVFFNVVMGGFETLTQFIENLAHSITGAVSGTISTIGDFLSDRWNDITDLIDWLNDLIAGIVDSISDFFGEIPVVGPNISHVIDGIARMLGLSSNAQDTADTANKQIAIIQAQLASGGTLIVDDFERSAGSSLGSNWEQWYEGPGAGSFGLDGHGNTAWNKSGTDWRRCHARWTADEMTLMSGSVSAVVKNIGETNLVGNEWGYNWLYARLTEDYANYIYLKWWAAGLRIGYVLSGTDHVLASQSRALKNGDTVEFQYGRGGLDYSFGALVNNSLVLPATDSGHSSLISADTKWVGQSVMATTRFLGQNAPSSLQVFTAVDAV